MALIRIVLSLIVPPLLFPALFVVGAWQDLGDADMPGSLAWMYGIAFAWLVVVTVIWRLTQLCTHRTERAGSFILIATALLVVAVWAWSWWMGLRSDAHSGLMMDLVGLAVIGVTGAAASTLSAFIAGVPFRKARALSRLRVIARP